jgi:oxaloacetate decarboxylase alpha subunit
VPIAAASAAAPSTEPASYRVDVNGKSYDVTVSPQGAVERVRSVETADEVSTIIEGRVITAPMAGTIVRVAVSSGQPVESGDVLVVLEAMKMETEIRAPSAGRVGDIRVKAGDAVALGAPLLALG